MIGFCIQEATVVAAYLSWHCADSVKTPNVLQKCVCIGLAAKFRKYSPSCEGSVEKGYRMALVVMPVMTLTAGKLANRMARGGGALCSVSSPQYDWPMVMHKHFPG